MKIRRMKLTNYAFFIGFFLFAMSCNSDIETISKSESIYTNNRSNSDFQWLESFQKHLLHQKDGTESSNSYSLKELNYAIEALINLAHFKNSNGVNKVFKSKTFQFPKNTIDLELFDFVYTEVNSTLEQIRDLHYLTPFLFDLDISENADKLSLKVSIIVKDNRSCGIENYQNDCFTPNSPIDCSQNVFNPDESYLLGLGGDHEFDETNPLPHEPIMCPHACGETPICEVASTWAMEELQSHLNASYCDPECPDGLFWDGTYSDIQTFSSAIPWDIDDENLFHDCFENPLDIPNFKACYCFDATLLNCMYSKLCEKRNSLEFPFQINIPDGYEFIHTDLGVSYFPNGGSPNSYFTMFWMSNTIGKPNCSDPLLNHEVGHALDTDLWK